MAARLDDVDAGATCHIVVASGELDLFSAPDLRELLLQVIGRGKTHLVVDLTDVSFVDSTVMSVLVQRRKDLALRGGSLALVGLNHDLRMIFDIAGLDRALPEYDSREAALEAAAA